VGKGGSAREGKVVPAGKVSLRCARCGTQSYVFDSTGGELVCGNCGFVMEERTQEPGVEWRAFTPEEKEQRSHTGAPAALSKYDMGLYTVIGSESRDAGGAIIPPSSKQAMYRLKTWDRRSMYYRSSDRNLGTALSQLSRLAEKLNVGPHVSERAAYVYRKALERNLVRGRSITGMMSASLYEACRNTGTPRTLKDVAEVGAMKKKELARCYRLLVRELGLVMPVVDPAKCVARIASRAGLSERAQRKALEILVALKRSDDSAGKDPTGLAATALYIASTMVPEEGRRTTQRDIAEAAGVTEVTIRNRSKGFKKLISSLENGE
jgi:transcription initiation factor TFIIB